MDIQVQKKLDDMLIKLLNHTEKYLDLAIEKNVYTKELAESVSVVLSVAYQRIAKKD